jgi:hypothetical protein
MAIANRGRARWLTVCSRLRAERSLHGSLHHTAEAGAYSADSRPAGLAPPHAQLGARADQEIGGAALQHIRAAPTGSVRTAFARILPSPELCCAPCGAGLYGPFIHIGAMIGQQMARFYERRLMLWFPSESPAGPCSPQRREFRAIGLRTYAPALVTSVEHRALIVMGSVSPLGDRRDDRLNASRRPAWPWLSTRPSEGRRGPWTRPRPFSAPSCSSASLSPR